ncbi:UDP-2,4-diacetamido-2,4,6-trideoxy-beta-L-altropyranose hydrolase [Asticcacaulis sp. DW145]|uniref:UDP-2,4-diacetamido-2,4, 6-trideoxy-beta-L-altropyranose hydrolase n=1 Tax=Asticcacaulis sp. DW145 TaxID=3095608 RepID=UPI003086623E|nr:UDP-2,4-diacetamido-2,4,6-trideoxy-beta-L-altropyranose hydrolase [Asticcacaulis sp. DW145]
MRIWVRTEASTRIGLGHFMRCYALAEAARMQGHEVVFLINDIAEAAIQRLLNLGIRCRHLDTSIGTPQDVAALRAVIAPGEVIVSDSYAIGPDYYNDLYTDYILVAMDDLAVVRPLNVHLLINAAPSAETRPYDQIAPYAVKCLGPAYALIRHEFRQTYPLPPRGHVSVIFGGSDPYGFTARCAEALADMGAAEIRLIAGPAHNDVDSLRALCARREECRLYLSPDNVAEVLSGATLVVTAAGGSLNEVAAMKLCALGLVVADNQASWLLSSPFPMLDARDGWPEGFEATVCTLLDRPDVRSSIAMRAHAQIDGRGCERVLSAIASLTL